MWTKERLCYFIINTKEFFRYSQIIGKKSSNLLTRMNKGGDDKKIGGLVENVKVEVLAKYNSKGDWKRSKW